MEGSARGSEQGSGRKLAKEGAVEMEDVGLCGRHVGVRLIRLGDDVVMTGGGWVEREVGNRRVCDGRTRAGVDWKRTRRDAMAD